MGTLFSGTGLISGLDITGLVDQLMALEARPRDNLKTRISALDAQKTAFLDISARISQMISRAGTLKLRTTFTNTVTSSSNEDVLKVTSGSNVAPGAYSFLVKQLATTHQTVSRGFASRTSAVGAGTLTLESSAARISRDARLDELNGYAGVQRGRFQLTDGAGKSAEIDITDALTVSEVVDRINQAGLNLKAAVRGDGLQLSELSGGPITVRESGGRVAADLGLLGDGVTSSAGALTGRGLVQLSSRTPLSALNDGNGIDRARAGNDFTITDLAGDVTVDLSAILKPDTRLERLNHGDGVERGVIRLRTFNENGSPIEREVDLSAAQTVNDVKLALEGALTGVSVTISSNSLIVGYDDKNDKTVNRLEIEDVGGRTAADLGLVGKTDNGRIRGGTVLAMETVGDLLAAINYASGNQSIEASLGATGLQLTSRLGAALSLTGGDSNALRDLGFDPDAEPAAVLTGGRLVAGLNSVRMQSLNGGRGYQLGVVSVSDGARTTEVDLGGAVSLQDALDRFNDAAAAGGMAFVAEVDSSGTRIQLRSQDSVTPLTVSDVSGDFATASGLAGSGPSRRSANLQKQYVSEGTLLSTLNGGSGVGQGTIKVTNSKGLAAKISLAGAATIGDVIRTINAAKLGDAPLGVTARINDTGDGIVLEDAAGGTQPLIVSDDSGTAARDLNLAGESADGTLDGTFEVRIAAGATTTLTDVLNQINADGALASASILNDGSPVSPYRLQIVSRRSGAAGELVIDQEGLNLDLATLARAQDAKVLMGGTGAGGLLVTSSTNTLAGAVPGLTVELTGTSDTAVQVTAAKNNDKLVEDMGALIKSINDALDQIDKYAGYNVETETAGILLGDSSLRSVESRLTRLFSGRTPAGVGGFDRFGDLGISVRNGRLEFNAETFKDVLAQQPEAVTDFFTDAERGFGAYLNTQLESLNNPSGLLKSRQTSLDRQRELLDSRVSQLDELLVRKRERLTRQFQAMESALAEMQSQQAALGQLGALAAQSR